MSRPTPAKPTLSFVTFAFYQPEVGVWKFKAELGRLNAREMEAKLHLTKPLVAIEVHYFEYDGTFVPGWILTQFKQKIDSRANNALDWLFSILPIGFLEQIVRQRHEGDSGRKTGTDN